MSSLTINKSFMNRFNLIGLFIILTAVFVYIIYKVIHVPITHDELGTIVHYSKFTYWEIMMHPDTSPNNHILNTIFTKSLMSLFGDSMLVLRMPNILSFLLYGFGIYRILEITLGKTSWFYIPGAILFVMNPYLLDFFGLCRGYGLSLGFTLISLSYALTAFKFQKASHLWLALIFSILASYANFTVLVYWAAVCVLIFLYFLLQSKQNKTLSVLQFFGMIFTGLLYVLLISSPIIKMNSDNQFVFWTSNGFIQETVLSLAHHGVYGSKIFLTARFIGYFIITISFLHLLLVTFKIIRVKNKTEEFQQPYTIATLLLFITVYINILQCWLLDTPNLNGRTALFFYPLFIVTLLTMRIHFDKLRYKWIKILMSFTIAFFGVHHLFHTATPKIVREWAYDANTFSTIEIIKEHSKNHPTSVSTNWLFNPSFNYHLNKEKNISLLPYNKRIDPTIDAAYFYIADSNLVCFDSTFLELKKFENGNTLLYNSKH